MLGGIAYVFLAIFSSARAPAAPGVERYRVAFAESRAPEGNASLFVIRSFRRLGQGFVVAVDPRTLTTQVLPEKLLKLHRLSWATLQKAVAETPYGRALADSARNALVEQDAGIVHALPPGSGIVLTIDLCPARRGLDRSLFTAIFADFGPEERPVPVGIAVTGLWMMEHAPDLAWLRQMERDREIAVTWINHSFNHRYDKDMPLSRNFLLQRGTDLDAEVLKTEAAMIENGLEPSVFFRFPGLVSDPALVRRVISYGLIAVGSDAWLAKGQNPSPGSIVLVHGNGNEPIGIERFLKLVRSERTAIRERRWLLFDLRDSVSREEGQR